MSPFSSWDARGTFSWPRFPIGSKKTLIGEPLSQEPRRKKIQLSEIFGRRRARFSPRSVADKGKYALADSRLLDDRFSLRTSTTTPKNFLDLRPKSNEV